MGRCKYCGKRGLFFPVDRDGLCKKCAPALLMQVQQSIRVLKESEKIINKSKNIDTQISRCDTMLSVLEGLIELEQRGIPTMNQSPLKLYNQVEKEKNGYILKKEKNTVLKLHKSDDTDKYMENYIEAQKKAQKAGSIKGKHYTEYIEMVRQLKPAKEHKKVIKLLLRLIDAVESEAKVHKSYGGDGFCAPWYYEQLAIVYRKEKQYSEEVAILERLHKQNNYLHGKAVLRLEKAKELQNKEKGHRAED